jgi:hypothetical protein
MRGHQTWWRMHRSWKEKKKKMIAEDLDGRKLFSLPCSFFFRAWMTYHLVELDCASWLCLYRAPLLNPLGSTTRADTQNGKELSQISTSRMTSPIGVRTSKLNRSSAQTKIHSLWSPNKIDTWRHKWDHDNMAQSGSTPCWILAWNLWYTSSTRANGRRLWSRHDIGRW